MAEATPVPVQGNTPTRPPQSFQEAMDVPESGYRTAIAIKHDERSNQVQVTFLLRDHDSSSATYHAICPRCQVGEITVAVKLKTDGSFAEAPACPMLCLACEDRLDAILEPDAARDLKDEPSGRETLRKYLRSMATRPWDRSGGREE